MSTLTVERLRDVLSYDPSTGEFRWAKQLSPRGPIDSLAGSMNNGYRFIRIDHSRFAAHRLAWLYVHGRWPDRQIDHVNGVRNDNRIANLREATRSQNAQNVASARKNSQSGFLGVQRQRSRWSARIYALGQHHYVGTFDTPEAAHAAYVVAKQQLHPFCRPERLVS